MKVLYDDEVTPSTVVGKECPKFVLEEDGKTITLTDRSGSEAMFTKEEYNRFIQAVLDGKVPLV